MKVPKPVPFGSSITEEHHFEGDDKKGREESRQSLRLEMIRLRSSLTSQETKYLEELFIHGNEIEVTLAREKLRNSSIFFDSTTEGWNSDTISLGPEHSVPSDQKVIIDMEHFKKSNTETLHEVNSRVASDGVCVKSMGSQGSEKRQTTLESRRKATALSKLWKAHETGLSLTKKSSQLSMLGRPVVGGVFRHRRQKPKFHRSASSSGVLEHLPAAPSSSGSASLLKQRPPLLLRRFSRPKLRSKSVSFGEIPGASAQTREFSETQSIPSLHKGSPLRSESIGSIPSIRSSHPIKSESESSIPSLLHGSPVRGDSFRSSVSIPSLHHPNPIKSDSMRSSTFTSMVSDLGDSSVGFESEEKKSDTPPIPDRVDVPKEEKMLRPVMIRDASMNLYQGEGLEVADACELERHVQTHRGSVSDVHYKSMLSFGDLSTIRSTSSFDESVSYERLNAIFRGRGGLQRSLSDDSMSGVFRRSSKDYYLRGKSLLDLSESTIALSDDELDHYDSWKIIEDETVNGYGGGDTLSFRILGTSATDADAHPHVLSPPLMESLQEFLPPALYRQNFWMKYSMVRDGSSYYTFLKNSRGSENCFLAIETVDGEVFGAFTREPWRKNWNFFGSQDSFLWRMAHSRGEMSHSVLEQAQRESEIEVYPFSGQNPNVQLCTHDMIALGGRGEKGLDGPMGPYKEHEWGFGLTVTQDLLNGTSSPCLTFNSPPLSKAHPDGSVFEIMNMELWALTPCFTPDDADRLELSKLFLHNRSH